MLAETWAWKKIAVFCAPFVLAVLVAVAWLLLRKTIRTRRRMEKQLRDDPDINEWLVVFNWSRKVLYVPTMLASVVAFAIMCFHPHQAAAEIVGGAWLAVFFLNFLVDEYEMNIKVLLILTLCLMVVFLWLLFMGWTTQFLRFFRLLHISISAMGYLTITLIFLLAVVVSWIRGLFYYVAITPNYLNIQAGPTETGEQVSREEYGTRIDTGDFLERLLGFGRLIVTFSDPHRQPTVLLISRIGRRARTLESIRGKLAIERHEEALEV